MELHTQPAMVLDDVDELAVTQVIARLRRVGSAREQAGLSAERSVGDPTDDVLLDQFWRRRSRSGHC